VGSTAVHGEVVPVKCQQCDEPAKWRVSPCGHPWWEAVHVCAEHVVGVLGEWWFCNVERCDGKPKAKRRGGVQW
jgi:hypothetical protein